MLTEPHVYKPMSHEDWLYQTLFAPSCQPQYGLNVVARAIGLALYMGFSKIRVWGSDCAAIPDAPPMPQLSDPAYLDWAKNVVMYADGRNVLDVYGPEGTMVQAEGSDFGNRRWHTRADMLITARHLVTMVKYGSPGQIELMGDILPNALMDWTDEQWDQAPNMTGKGSITGFEMHKDYVSEDGTKPDVSVYMTIPHQDHLFEHVKQNAKYARRMIGAMPFTHKGKTLSICGAGPSLRGFVGDLRFTHEVWACNSALPYLMDRGVRVTHGLGIDQGLGMLEDWKRVFPVTYYIASSVHPELVAHLRKNNAVIRWFHNFLGINNPEGWEAPDVCILCHRVAGSPLHQVPA